MIGVGAVYTLAGVAFAGVAVLSALDRTNPKRGRNTLFWGLFAVSFLAGGRIGDLANGGLAIGMAAVAAFGGLGGGAERASRAAQAAASAARVKDWLFVPALAVPAATLLGALVLVRIKVLGAPLIDPKQATPISLAFGVIIALAIAAVLIRPRPLEPLQEARRLMDSVGWAALLPQMLAALGVVFAISGVGRVIGHLAGLWLPLDNRIVVVCAFTLGMALFTLIMGNAFAAFPVMVAAIGAPLIVQRFGGDAAVMGAIGMLSGFCGTLATPMAANFNIVPAALLELKDRYAVIKAQLPTAAFLLLANTLMMQLFAFRS